MRLKKYITFDQLYYWSQTTAAFTFNGVLVNPASQMSTVEQILLPFLNGSLDNPYSTTTPKEKLPTYFTVAGDIGNYINEEYADRLVASPYRGGEYYPPLGRNLNNDEAMEVILQELVSKTYHFASVYGYQFIKLFGTAGLKYDPRYSIQEHIRKVSDFGIHETDNQYGARLKTDTLGPTSETKQYGATSESTQYGQQTNTDSYGKHEEDITYGTHTDSTQFGQVTTNNTYGQRTATHSETQMNDLTFKNKSQDVNASVSDGQIVSSHTDSTTFGSHSDNKTIKAKEDTHTQGTHTDTKTSTIHSDTTSTTTVTNTTGDAAVKDTITDKAHQNVETTDREATGVKTIQELIAAERALLDWNPVVEFFKTYTDKIMLRVYCY